MTKNADSQIETLREKIKNGERELDEANWEGLLEFSDGLFLVPSQVGDQRHFKLLRHNVRMAEYAGDLVEALESEEAAKEIVQWIHRTYDNAETNRDYRVALKQFGRRVTDQNEDDPPSRWNGSHRTLQARTTLRRNPVTCFSGRKTCFH